jgi:ornithine cyclodeaminase
VKNRNTFDFAVVGGEVIYDIISKHPIEIVNRIAQAYKISGNNNIVNPDSYFLRFPEKPSVRIIALPAYIGGDVDIAGIKWIASFPENIKSGIPRASAVLILNDYETGYPFACLESSIISAARTAGSAVLGAEWLNKGKKKVTKLGFVGNGLIARYIFNFFVGNNWEMDNILLYDLSSNYSDELMQYMENSVDSTVKTVERVEDLIVNADMIVFATTAPTPYVENINLFEHNPVVLNISLRDLHPDIILSSYNVVDDVDHCLKADTSPHLAEQKTGNRDFITGTIDGLMSDTYKIADDKPAIYSPFGMGVLDLAIGMFVYNEANKNDRCHRIDDFFFERTRMRKCMAG